MLVEFSVNDDQDAHHSADDCIRGMEGIVRHVSRYNPQADIVMIQFVNPEMLATSITKRVTDAPPGSSRLLPTAACRHDLTRASL